MPAPIRLGAAVELPEGVFNVIGEWRYRGIALQWWLWELDDGAGPHRLLAKVGDNFYTPRFESAQTLPQNETLEFEGAQYHLRHHGEARAEHTDAEDHNFWLADFRHYVADDRVLIFTADNDETHRLAGAELDEKLVRVYGS
jgi:hypothetical protein